MPGSIDGLKLAHAVRNRWPPIKIIIVSGHVELSQKDLPANTRFFQKHIVPKNCYPVSMVA
jgi:two-component system, response regulator PdtaR